MSLLAEKATFDKVSSAVGNTQTITLSNGSLTPKALIMFTTMGLVGTAVHARLSAGISDGANEYAVAGNSEDAVSGSNTGRYNSSTAITLLDNTPALGAECTVTSFAAGSFALNWTTNDATVPRIHYYVIGGDDLTDVKVGTFTGKTSTGDQSTTGVGFKPDALFMLSSHDTAIGSAVSDGNILSLGMAVSDTHEASLCAGDLDATGGFSEAATSAWGSEPLLAPANGHCIRFLTNKSGVLDNDGRAAFKSMDADGFTMDWIEAAGAAWHIGYLALRGGQYSVDLQRSSVGMQTTVVGFEPKGILTMNGDTANAGATLDPDYKPGIGAADSGINEGTSSAMSDDAVDPSACDRWQKTDKATVHLRPGTGIASEANLNAFTSVGYEYNWTTQNNGVVYTLAMGDARPHTGPALGSSQVGVY